jgi:hypothetical protein
MITNQTAVEWLIQELGEYFPHEIGGIHLMVEKAKQMEKEQIAEACKDKLSAADLLFDMEAEYEAKFKQQDNGR